MKERENLFAMPLNNNVFCFRIAALAKSNSDTVFSK